MKPNFKTYEIDGVEVRLKDLTLDEADEVSSLLTVTREGMTVSNENSKRFLSIVLEGVNGNNVNINFGKCTETTALEVLKDFFTRRIESGNGLRNFFSTLTKGLGK